MSREYKIWDNGDKVTVIKSFEDSWSYDFNYIVGDDVPFGILGCNLKNYDINYHNGLMKFIGDLFEWVMTEKRINSFKFTVADLMKSYGYDSYTDRETSEEVPVDTKREYTVREQKQLIMDMFYNNCLDASMTYNILNQIEFDKFILKPFYAYIHSDISISLGDYKDPWDSGVAGFAWYEIYDETEEEAERSFVDYFNTYNDYIQGLYDEYSVRTYEKINGKWNACDDYWDVAKSFEDVWENYGYTIENVVDSFSEEDRDIVRKKIKINDERILEFLDDLPLVY